MEMDLPMAGNAKSDEILVHIASQKTPRLNMMDLEIFGRSASLASPAIPLEHPLAKAPIGVGVQSKPRLSHAHDAFGIRCKNSRCCEFGSSK